MSLRHEDMRLLTGRAAYSADIVRPGMLHAAFVRSTMAHAGIVRIDTKAAAAHPGVAGVYTAAELPFRNECPVLGRHPGLTAAVAMPLLAERTVKFVGQPLVLIIAADRYVAEDAAELVDVEYEPLAVCSELKASLSPGALTLHETAPGNVAGRYQMDVGDVAAAMEAADLRRQFSLSISRGTAVPMETRCITTEPNGRHLTVWSGTQRPHGLHSTLLEYLGLDVGQLRILSPDTGGAFGVKSFYYPEDILVPWASLLLGKALSWVEDRAEHFLATTPEPTQEFSIEAGFNRSGKLVALMVDFRHDMGAYAGYGFAAAQNTANHIMGPYRLDNFRVSWQGVYTNRTPSGTYRGAGRPQGVYVIERVMDEISRTVQIDRAEVRRVNMIAGRDIPFDTGINSPIGHVTYESGDFMACMEDALKKFDYDRWLLDQEEFRRTGRLIGIGIANYVECSITQPGESVELALAADGRIMVRAGFSAQGQGHETALAAVLSNLLGVSCHEVVVVLGDTDQTPPSVGTFGSRVAIMASGALADAAEKFRTLAVGLAAHLLEVEPGLLYWTGDGIVQQREGLVLSRADLARAMSDTGMNLQVTGTFAAERTYTSSGTHVAAVEVQPERCAVEILDYLIAHDSGTAIDPAGMAGQIVGGYVQGVGGTLSEELVYDKEGQLATGNLVDYRLPVASQVLPPTLLDSGTPFPTHPMGAKGAGESGLLPVYAVLASAIEDALGLPVRRSPIARNHLAELLATWMDGREAR